MLENENLIGHYPDEEDESDLTELSADEISDVVVSTTDWTTETLMSQLHRGNIDLSPAFQRRSAWQVGLMSRFVESTMLQMPIPQIVLAERPEKKGTYIVIDGKQRLLALRKFISDSDDQNFPPYALSTLEFLKQFNGKTYSELKGMSEAADFLNAMDNHTIRTVVLRNWSRDEILHLVFQRINTGSVKLSPQELRQSLFPGSFLTFADSFTGESQAFRWLLNNKAPDFRMRDVEIFVRFIGYSTRLSEYSGNLKKFLDETSKEFNRSWSNSEELVVSLAEECEAAIMCVKEIFGEDAAF